VAQSVFTAADLKTVQVHIFPAESDLQYPVKLGSVKNRGVSCRPL
jgi:hypothetical protein